MIRYHLNLKMAMFLLPIIFAVAAFANNTLKIKAELPPKVYILPIGNEQTPGGPEIKHYDPSVAGNPPTGELEWPIYYDNRPTSIDSNITGSIGEGSGTFNTGKRSVNSRLNTNPYPALNAIPCQFPPIIETSNGVAMVVYKKEELGLNGLAVTMNKLRLNALYSRENGYGGENTGGWFAYNLKDLGYGDDANTAAYMPYNVARQIGMNLSLTLEPTELRSVVGDRTPVQIYIKNGAEFNTRGEQDFDKAFPPSQGWVKVYDGYYDYLDKEQWDQYTPNQTIPWTVQSKGFFNQEFIDLGALGWMFGAYALLSPTGAIEPYSTTSIMMWAYNEPPYKTFEIYASDDNSATKGFNVTIPFAQKFNYTGGDITVAFVNPSESRGIKSDIWQGTLGKAYEGGATLRPGNPIDEPTTYRFRCYAVTDAEADGNYLGPKFSVGSQVIPQKLSREVDENGDSITVRAPWTQYGLHVTYGSWLGNSYNDLWTNNQEWLEESEGDVTPWNGNKLTYSVPLTDLLMHNEPALSDGYGSVRPRVGLDVEVQSLVTSSFANGANFKNSTQLVYNADRTLNDTTWVVGEFTIYADDSKFPLNLKEVHFDISGTKAGLSPTVCLYRDLNGNGDITTSERLLAMNVTDNSTQVFDIAELKKALRAGENRYFFVFEVKKSNAACNDKMVVNLTDFVLGDREKLDTDKEYVISLNSPASRAISFNPVNITNINNDKRDRRACWEGEATTVKLDAGLITGQYDGIEWSVSYDNGNNWTVITDAPNAAVATFTPNETVTNYKLRVLYDRGLCQSLNDSVVWNIAYEPNIESVDFSYEGKISHTDYEMIDSVSQGEFLEFKANAVHTSLTIPVYNWEISTDGGTTWVSAGKVSALNYVVPAGSYGWQWMRVTATPDPTVCACTKTVISSKIFKFYVRPQKIEFNFINRLPGYKLLCPNDTITLDVAWAGTIDEKNCWWEKDGEPLLIGNRLVTERSLKISNTDKSIIGSYRYRVKARTFDPAVEIEPKWVDVLTNACVIDVVPKLEIFYQSPSYNYATPYIPVVCLVETSYIDAESPYQGYQWYKHTDRGDIRLVDNDAYRFGSTSNQLILISNQDAEGAIGGDVFTFNGSYYYLEITGACSTITTRDNPIYVLPSEGLRFVVDAKEAVVCSLEEEAIYTVEANEGIDITGVKYQWYIDGTKATDADGVSGSSTPTLTVSPTLDDNMQVYCEVTADVYGSASTIISDTVGVALSFLRNLTTTNYIDDTELTIDLRWETNNSATSHTVDVYLNNNIFKTEDIPTNSSLSNTKTHNIAIPVDEKFALLLENSTSDEIDITVEIKNECGDVVTNNSTISAKDINAVPTDIDENNDANMFDILPNPVNDIVTIGFSSSVAAHTTIDLCDISGQTITSLYSEACQPGYNKLSFNLTNLNISTGTYIIRLNGDKGIMTKHFVFSK